MRREGIEIKNSSNGKKQCMFCGHNELIFLYNYDNYQIIQCKKCLAAQTKNMPSEEELKKFYDGFLFNANIKYKEILSHERFKNWFESYNLPQNAKMLDIGGGGGFFSFAFEFFNLGEATYIDLDSQACEFAKKLNITNIINDNVSSLVNMSGKKYDFIYCRHVIEHLVNPTEIIDFAINLLSDKGVFILQLPNGLSYEQIFEKPYFLERINNFKRFNNFSLAKSLKLILSVKTAYAIAPPRHLWAISKKAMDLYLAQNRDITYNLKIANLNDDVFSPWHVPKNPIYNFFVNNFLAKINGGVHMIYEIRKK